jgi:5-formyltetrahydrofolate cyclo-ligase
MTIPLNSKTAVDQAKQAIRERLWARLEAARVVEPGVAGYIPDFTGSDRAAARLAGLEAWARARVVKAVPDSAQRPVRRRALEDGKLVYLAAPRLATAKPFYVLDPRALPVSPAEAADPAVAARVAPAADPDEMQPVDLIIVGSVAVSERGTRLGKGAGYSDLEVALLAEAGLVKPHTVIATTVHELQVVDEDLPELEHDFRVDVIVTPDRVIGCGQPKRPKGLSWHALRAEQIAAIPVLARRARQSPDSPA